MTKVIPALFILFSSFVEGASGWPCNTFLLRCESIVQPAIWVSLRRPTPFQEQDWFTCQCQRRTSPGFTPAATYRSTNTETISVSSSGGYIAGEALKFVSITEDALVGLSCPADTGIYYCEIRGWSQVAIPWKDVVSIWGGAKCSIDSDSELLEVMDGSSIVDYPVGPGTDALYLRVVDLFETEDKCGYTTRNHSRDILHTFLSSTLTRQRHSIQSRRIPETVLAMCRNTTLRQVPAFRLLG